MSIPKHKNWCHRVRVRRGDNNRTWSANRLHSLFTTDPDPSASRANLAADSQTDIFDEQTKTWNKQAARPFAKIGSVARDGRLFGV